MCYYMSILLLTPSWILQVSNLFARDEIDEITGELISAMKKEYPRRPPTNENLYDYFLMRVRNNLHVVLCFSPVSYGRLQTVILILFFQVKREPIQVHEL